MGPTPATAKVADGSVRRARRSLPPDRPREVLTAAFERSCTTASDALDRDDAVAARGAAAEAVRLARRLDEPGLEGEARLIYGRSLGFSGSLRAGLAQIERAERLLDGEARGGALVQRSALLYRMGEPVAALEAGQRALELILDDTDHRRARAFNNVGIVLLYLGRSEEARSSLAEAERLHRAASRPAHAAQSLANRSMALARLGDLVGALRGFEDAHRELCSLGLFEGQNVVAKAEILLDAGLLREVQRELPPVIAALDASGMLVDAAEGVLYLALALVGLGDPGAIDAAQGARRRFNQVGSAGWEAMASVVEVRARLVSGDTSEAALSQSRRAVAALGRRRLRPYELEAQLLCGQLAEAAGRLAEGRRRFGLVAAQRATGTVRQRAMGWEALARLRRLAANRPGAMRAADAGLRVIERHRDAIGATDLRAGASAQGVELAGLALHLAIGGRDPYAVLRWSERWRAGSLYRRPIHPPADPAVAELLTTLRETAVAVRVEAGAGRSTAELERRLASLERALGDRVRSTAAVSASGASSPSGGGLDVGELRTSLGTRALVEYAECAGQLVVVVLDERRCVMRPLGGADDIARLASATSFALRKLSRLSVGSPAATSARAGFFARLDALRRSLFEPVVGLVSDRELVVVPTGRLHAIPWQLLVGAEQVVAVAPSAALWQRAARAVHRSGDVVAVAGPGLPGAEQEIDAVRRHHGSSVCLVGREATVGAVNAAVDGASLVHLAAHGDIRGDNPLFSSFRLADGPQTVYDLQCLSAAPDVVVLSACNSALSQVEAGEELLGLVASLLSLGTSTAIAAVLPIPDMATAPLMDRLHRRIACGDGPGLALSRATAALDLDDPGAIAACAAFVCLGSA